MAASTPAPTLAQIQRLLSRLITAPSGVADALRELGEADGLLRDGLEAIVNGDPVLPAARRLDIYANMYFFRLLDALKEDFPTVRSVVGTDDFHNLITDYLLRHPPTHPSLRYAGQFLPGFVREHRLGQAWPFLGDLARFEWALADAFDAADAPVLTPSTLAAVAPDAWAGLRFCLTPSVQLLALEWAVLESWQRAQLDQAPGEAAARPTWVRVWRRELRVLHREIAADEFAALRSAAAGEPFASVCEAVAEHVGAEPAATRVGELLEQWVADGLLAAGEA